MLNDCIVKCIICNTFIDINEKLCIINCMKGWSINEIAELEGMPYITVAQRISRGGHEPIFTGNLYSDETYEAIKKSRGKGRPKKAPEQDIPATDKRDKKRKKQS